ncbi:hypothetical protein EVG20_g237 [Dentipellis fragilis]|uniref:Uncharacterized protein n=1 Tax=Dentipellis fragilis TaxID=205917 RepID=A0A4Y9ZFG5_9AGAM|nr:hypothetical protein EVG20_g237 [Dentipellis fragilis]
MAPASQKENLNSTALGELKKDDIIRSFVDNQTRFLKTYAAEGRAFLSSWEWCESGKEREAPVGDVHRSSAFETPVLKPRTLEAPAMRPSKRVDPPVENVDSRLNQDWQMTVTMCRPCALIVECPIQIKCADHVSIPRATLVQPRAHIYDRADAALIQGIRNACKILWSSRSTRILHVGRRVAHLETQTGYACRVVSSKGCRRSDHRQGAAELRTRKAGSGLDEVPDGHDCDLVSLPCRIVSE